MVFDTPLNFKNYLLDFKNEFWTKFHKTTYCGDRGLQNYTEQILEYIMSVKNLSLYCSMRKNIFEIQSKSDFFVAAIFLQTN